MKLGFLSWDSSPIIKSLAKVTSTLLSAETIVASKGGNPRYLPNSDEFAECDLLVEVIGTGTTESQLLDTVYSWRAPRPSPILSPLLQVLPIPNEKLIAFTNSPDSPWRAFPDQHAILVLPPSLLDVLNIFGRKTGHMLSQSSWLTWAINVSHNDYRIWLAKLYTQLCALEVSDHVAVPSELKKLSVVVEGMRELTNVIYPHDNNLSYRLPALLRDLSKLMEPFIEPNYQMIKSAKFFGLVKQALKEYLFDLLAYKEVDIINRISSH